MKIDAEVYFWKYERQFLHPLIRGNKVLQQQYLPEQIAQNLHRNGMDGCIATTAEDAEVQTRFLAELAATHFEILGIIGWINLYDNKSDDKIQEFKQYSIIKGYRVEASRIDAILQSTMESVLTGQYCLDITAGAVSDFSHISNWLGAHPEQTFILRDGAQPDAKQPPSKTWEANIRTIAENQNLSCKLSGLFIHGHQKNWKPADFYPFLEIIFDAFGTDRLLFASEWPFLLLSGIYVQWKSLIEKFMEKYRPEEREKVFGENARRLYRI
ncbi:MAG TPA: amidohydrolase family protein [Puia sp.]|nr:amidohydrolase family protein [Puia sp.]